MFLKAKDAPYCATGSQNTGSFVLQAWRTVQLLMYDRKMLISFLLKLKLAIMNVNQYLWIPAIIPRLATMTTKLRPSTNTSKKNTRTIEIYSQSHD